MDTISSSLNSFKIPTSFHSTPREIYHFRNPKSHNHHLPLNPHFSYSTAKTSNSIPAKPTTLITHPFNSSSPSRSPKKSTPRTKTVHCKAASGYATALLDMAQSNNSLAAVERDVKRLSKWVSRHNEELFAVLSDPCVGENEKGKVMKEVVVKGRFHRYLVKLVNLLVKKNKVKMMSEVLSEFQRIYDELSGTQLVFLQCEMERMELKQKEDFLFRIAEKARKLSGAVKVKVKHAISVA